MEQQKKRTRTKQRTRQELPSGENGVNRAALPDSYELSTDRSRPALKESRNLNFSDFLLTLL
jgi:hypothetical protein